MSLLEDNVPHSEDDDYARRFVKFYGNSGNVGHVTVFAFVFV